LQFAKADKKSISRQDAKTQRRKEGKKERKTKGRSFCGLIMINNLFSKRVFHIAF